MSHTARAWLATSLIASAILLAQGLFGAQSWQHRRRLQAELVRVQADNDHLAQDIARMQRRIEALQTSSQAQQHAVRDSLGWVRPGEWVVHLPEDNAERMP